MNLLHRDISPDNIYITTKGESRLLDFGAARVASGDGKSVSVILKHGYAPEEQYSSHGNQGPWTDVYAMGATLYRCITGQLPPDSLECIHGDAIKTPSELGIRIPAHVESAVMKALAVKTDERFPKMEAFIGALNGHASAQELAGGIGRRVPTTAYGQTDCKQPSGSAAAGKASAFFRIISYMYESQSYHCVGFGRRIAGRYCPLYNTPNRTLRRRENDSCGKHRRNSARNRTAADKRCARQIELGA